MLRQIVFLVCLCTLVGCAPRGVLNMVPTAGPDAVEHTIFVGTTREPEPGARFSNTRTETLSFGEYVVAVPPDRGPGEIAYPRSLPDPARDFVTTSARSFERAPDFTAALARELATRPRGRRAAIVFVHGFNTNFAEGLYRSAQLAHDFGIEGVTLHYSWPSAASPLGYAHDRDSSLFARTGFDRFLDAVIASNPDELLILAHSMGALLTMETLRQMALATPGRVGREVDGLVLLSPDIDVDVFRAQVHDIGHMPESVVVFTSQRDRALLLSARLSGQRDRLGNIESVEEVADLKITVLDVTGFSRGLGHFTAGSSPDLIRLLRNVDNLQRSLNTGAPGRPGLLPGTAITVQNATAVILSPLTALAAQ
ncbi:alpha/beta hydrolase [Rhodovulum euryhalinum]|uniref:Esterase/lipase superfamily enzyme n=1 Tax=Rhodovulum euryhalinum TaxID=35805 RepID=A0A4V6NPB9_9RHOB|nr:alpha/beta fold hydrolase [Rhodovulum euryhalinum]TCO73420.1 esterase/lipase superfamily enzyme [Rhodovulum euryhalinum]